MRLFLLFLVTKLAAGQLALTNDVELVPGMANMPQITSLDVQCEKSGMTVSVTFSQPFDGVIFSKGHFSNPACRYVEADTGQRNYQFVVPMDGCGTSAEEKGDTEVSNTVIFQMDPAVQEVWDTAKKISCVWTGSYNKAVNFKPLQVSMLEVVQTRFEGDDVKCWMDIQRGTYPNTSPMDGILRIGESLTVMVYLKETGTKLDVAVRDCWAYGEPEFENPDTPSLQLTGTDGCPTRMKLMHFWARTYDTFDTGATLITYANMSAFKFPDRMQVFLTCNVEICTDRCDNRCVGEPSQPVTFITKPDVVRVTTPLTPTRPPPPAPLCRPGSTDPRCKPGIVRPVCGPGSTDPACRPTVPSKPLCYPGSTDPGCLKPTTSKPNCYPGSSDPRCARFTTPKPATAPPNCYPGARDPRCPQPITRPTPKPTTAPPNCYPGARDPRCPKATTPRPSTRPTTQFTCRIGSKDPRCQQPTTPNPGFTQFFCVPGSRDPRCPQPTTPRPITTPTTQFTCRPGSRDPRCPQPTTSRPRCYPGSTDPQCPRTTPRPTPRPTQPTTPFRCVPGSRDPRCPQPTTSKPRCLPGSTDPQCPRTTPRPTPKPTTQPTTPFRCVPGSRDPRCPQPTTSRPRCYPGSTDPQCRQTTPRPTPKPTTQFKCLPGSRDPRCPQPTTSRPNCYPGSPDPRCRSETTPQPTTTFFCTPGSKDPRCRQPSVTCPPGSTDPECVIPSEPICVPGTNDPRCPTTPRPFRCTPGSRDPRCPQPTTRPTLKPTTRPTARPTTQVGDGSNQFTFTTKKPSHDQDFHGDKDPKYHAFHSWLYQPAPRPRNRVRGRREVDESKSMMVSVGVQQLVEAPQAKSGHIVVDTEGENLLVEMPNNGRLVLPLRDAQAVIEDVPVEYDSEMPLRRHRRSAVGSETPQRGEQVYSSKNYSILSLSATSAILLFGVLVGLVGIVIVTARKWAWSKDTAYNQGIEAL